VNNYYIVKHWQDGESRLVQIVERRMAELPEEIAKRCHEIIDSIRPVGSDADYCFYDRESLQATNLDSIKEQVFVSEVGKQ
tara:strand:+ start:496 stop:738 length:243 start_codon:yes stop_codon:yes gene_type:complete